MPRSDCSVLHEVNPNEIKKKYIDQSKRDTVKDIIKVRLHIWNLKKNNRKEEERPLCSLCQIEDDTTEHVLQCGRDQNRKQKNTEDNKAEEWKEVVQIFRENKIKRERNYNIK